MFQGFQCLPVWARYALLSWYAALAIWLLYVVPAQKPYALVQAAEIGDAATVSAMLEADTSGTLRDTVNSRHLFRESLRSGDARCMTALLRYGIKWENEAGGTAGILIEGAEQLNPAVIKALLPYVPNVNARDTEGKTALMYADNAAVAETLIHAGADVNAQDIHGHTPLMSAADSPDIVAVLLKYGAKVDARDTSGRTALEWANVKLYDIYHNVRHNAQRSASILEAAGAKQ